MSTTIQDRLAAAQNGLPLDKREQRQSREPAGHVSAPGEGPPLPPPAKTDRRSSDARLVPLVVVEMVDGGGANGLHRVADRRRIGDVHAVDRQTRQHVGKAPCVGIRAKEHVNRSVVGEQTADEIGSDEPARAAHEDGMLRVHYLGWGRAIMLK